MQVTLGEEGSGVSKEQPFFLLPVGNMGEDWPPFMLPLLLSLLLREEWRVADPSRNLSVLPGLRIDLDDIFIDDVEFDDEALEVKQMKSSLLCAFSPSMFFVHSLAEQEN